MRFGSTLVSLSVAVASTLPNTMLVPFSPGSEPFSWETELVGGREYFPAERVAAFYSFDLECDKGHCHFRRGKDGPVMTWSLGQPRIDLHGIRFRLNYPLLAGREGGLLISRMDVEKMLDPVLRPWFIRDAEPFSLVVIDPRHGGRDGGAKGPEGFEKVYNLDVAKRLKEKLRKAGVESELTRKDDSYVSLTRRVLLANRHETAVFVSIHFNHGGGGIVSDAHGIETYALAPRGTGATNDGTVSAKAFAGNRLDAMNIALATAVHAATLGALATEDRGIRRARFHVLRDIQIPAILFEGGYLSHTEEGVRIHDEAYRESLAEGIALGLLRYRQAMRPAPPPAPSSP